MSDADEVAPDGRMAQAQLDLAAARAQVEELGRALQSSRQIGMAMGILMERHRLAPDRAFQVLKQMSQRRNVKLREVADAIVEPGSAAPA
ncbi:ANTAR domain-containing protein [Blastococcus haudaquaticus]|uniref:ANTAR domain-containing protein n=1 Tax=Blastococcus haudaquaticus TaxID=1938745 RepID=UPI000BE22A58|nr:ANTAR domain-containing protein [Blastococcus haudaquaticus]